MASAATPDYAREKRLIEQLEFRIASADTSQKLQTILQKFLPALLLKLATQDVNNRNLTIKTCQYINQRLKIDATIQLPVADLIGTFRDSPNAFVKQFSLLFVQQGLDRLSQQDAVATLPAVLRSSIQATTKDSHDAKISSVSLDFLLRVLQDWKPPMNGSKEDVGLKSSFDLSSEQTGAIASQLSSFFLFDPKGTSSSIPEDLEAIYRKHLPARGAVVAHAADFLFTSVFSDIDRFVPATILSVDANASASNRADTMFKQCNFDLESEVSVRMLFDLYANARTRLQTRILTLLTRSKASTDRIDKLVEIVDAQLNAPALNLEERKLRAAMFAYLTWAVRVSSKIYDAASHLQASLREFVETQGWPVVTGLSAQDAELRARAYESIGLLSASTREITSEQQLDLVSWLFTSLRCDTSPDAKHCIEESLSRLLVSTVATGTDNLQRLKEMLLWNVLSKEGDEDPIYHLPTRNVASYPAVRFANKVLPLSDVDARAIDVLSLLSDRREVVEEAQRGLDPSWHAANARLTSIQNQSQLSLPKFSSFAERLFGPQSPDSSELRIWDSGPAIAGLVQFGRNLLAYQAWENTSFAIALENSDWQSTIENNLRNEAEARTLLQQQLAAEATEFTVQLLEACYVGMTKSSVECGQIGLELTSLASNGILSVLDQTAFLNFDIASRISGLRTYGCRIAGIVLSSLPDSNVSLQSGIEALGQWQAAVGQQLAAVEVLLLQSAYVLSRTALRGNVDRFSPLNNALIGICLEVLDKSTDKSIRQVAYTSIGQLTLCSPRGTEIPKDSIDKLIELMLADSKKENEVAISSLGRLLSLVWTDFTETQKTEILQKLYDLHEVRRVEFQFALGEALAVAALGFDSNSTLTEFDVDAPRPTGQARADLFNRLFDDILEKSTSTKPALKKANGIWLLSLVQFCTLPELLKPRLRDSQAAFSRLLNDRDEVVQETGSRGLGIVYEKGDKTLREDLVRDLVQSFTGNNAKTSGTVTESTQLFEAGALPTENGQSVTTYKDIVSLAQEMGDPSLVYRFMNLASNNAIWSSRAAFGRFGLSGVLSDSTYLQENKKFYPKLFRYRFDPNPNVQRSMGDIWKALVKDSNAVVDENFDLIMEDLLKSIIYGREWRAREASCAAIADLVQGREVEKFEKYLDEVWKVAFKVLDDVKESVRVAAMKLCRTLTNMLIRNLEVGEGTSKRATTMLRHAMPFLLQQMDAGAGKEVQSYAIVTLLDVVKKAPPRSLRNYAPVILESLINSLSSLEHESINYLHLNADKYGLTADKLDGMRVSSIGASPVSDAIERCIDSLSVRSTRTIDAEEMDVDEVDPLQDAMKRLESCFKVTIGLPSRVGLSRTMITLVVRHHNMFRPFADRFVKLTRKNILDRNATISQSFSTALAYLLRLASEKEVRQTIAYAQKLYFESQETSHRAVAGEMVQAVSKASNDVLVNFASSFLPFAFVGRKDLDDDTKKRFEVVWEDNVGGSRAVQLYLREIVSLVTKHIESTLWPIRHACCFAVADLVSSTGLDQKYNAQEAELLWPLVVQALSGKTWDGKETVVAALPKFVKNTPTLWPEKTKEIKAIAIREAKRKNDAYRPHALTSLAEFARIRLDLDISGEVIAFLVEIVEDCVDNDKMEIDDKSVGNGRSRYVLLQGVLRNDTDMALSETLRDETISSTITCLFAVLRRCTSSNDLDQALSIINRAHALRVGAIEQTLYQEAMNFVERLDEEVSEKDSSESRVSGGGSKAGPNVIGASVSDESIERFLNALVLALYEPDPPVKHASDLESLRRTRIQLGLKVLETKFASPAVRETLRQRFATWLEQEPSAQLRVLIQQALDDKKA